MKRSYSSRIAVALCTIMFFYGCGQPREALTPGEIQQVESEIIKVSEKHASDLVKLNHKEVMKFYSKDLLVFGDGFYWGDYYTVDSIWSGFTSSMKKMFRWDLRNHKIHVFSKNAASYLVEFFNERIEWNGDTTRVVGCFSYGMQKIDGEWKAVTADVTHIYNMKDTTRTEKWWYGFSPGVRK